MTIKELLLIVTIVVRVSAQDEAVGLEYLGGARRINDQNVWDFSFCCNVKGPNLVWVVNGTGIGGFHPGDLQTVHMESLSTFNYTSTLLSSRTVAGNHRLDSILIVSVSNNLPINVRCESDAGSNSTNNLNSNKVQSTLPFSEDGSTRLVQLWDSNIVQSDDDVDDDNVNTRCYMCVVYSTDQLWETNTQDQFALDTRFQPGVQLSVPSADNNLLRLQMIAFNVHPSLLSLLLVTDISFSKVSCKANGTSATLNLTVNIEDNESTSSSVAVPKTTTTAEGTSQSTIDEVILQSNSVVVPIVATILLVTIITLISVVMVSIVLFKIKKRSNIVKDQL